ncbi:MAG: hypothetical protein RL885_05220 [Planctomycetota bacterium]
MLALLNRKATKTLRRFHIDPDAGDFLESITSLRSRLLSSGEYGHLERVCRAYIDLNGPDAEWLRDLGVAQLFLGSQAAASRKLRRSRDLDRRDPATVGYLGICHLFAGREAEGAESLHHARTLADEGGQVLPDLVEGFAWAVLDGEFETAGDFLRPFLKLRMWRRLFDQIAFTPIGQRARTGPF